MKILIEGPDGSGKSTLAKALANRWLDENKNFTYKHITPEDTYEYNKNYLMSLINQNDNCIFDRGHLTNVVYYNVFKDHARFTDETLYMFDKTFDRIIIALPSDLQKYLENFDKCKNMRVEKYTIMRDVYWEYYNILQLSLNKYSKVWQYDYQTEDMNEYLDKVLKEN